MNAKKARKAERSRATGGGSTSLGCWTCDKQQLFDSNSLRRETDKSWSIYTLKHTRFGFQQYFQSYGCVTFQHPHPEPWLLLALWYDTQRGRRPEQLDRAHTKTDHLPLPPLFKRSEPSFVSPRLLQFSFMSDFSDKAERNLQIIKKRVHNVCKLRWREQIVLEMFFLAGFAREKQLQRLISQ